MVEWVWNDREVKYIYQSPAGPVGRHLRNVGKKMEAAARAQVGRDTNELASKIYSRVYNNARGKLELEVGADSRIAYIHHEGTPPHMITPGPSVKAVRFPGRTGVVFAKAVMHPGTKPNRFLSDNLVLVRT